LRIRPQRAARQRLAFVERDDGDPRRIDTVNEHRVAALPMYLAEAGAFERTRETRPADLRELCHAALILTISTRARRRRTARPILSCPSR
jgi:hypothetical protein